MRITQNSMFNGLRQKLMTNAERLMKAQETTATQKRFNKLSDNPIDGGRALDLTGAISRSKQYLANIDRVNSIAGVQDATLDQVNTMLTRAKALMLKEANQATSTATTREAARIEMAELTGQLVEAANVKFDGKYIFSGFRTDTPAFAGATVAATPAGTNAGQAAVTTQQVADASRLTYHNYELRFTAPNQFDVVDTTTGVTTAMAQPYTSGAPIRFDGIELRLTDSPGAPAVGDIFTVATTPPGVYQGDSQAQDVEIQPGTRLAQNVPGDRVFQGVGVMGGVNLFDILNQANTALRSNDRPQISALLTRLDQAREQISNERVNVGGRVNLLEAVKDRQNEIQSNLEMMKSGIEDIDLAEAMTQLNKQQNVYEATLSASSKIVQSSLLDFLR